MPQAGVNWGMTHDLNHCFPLRRGRVHEVFGPAAFGFAAVACAQARGDLLWITEGWRAERINPLGLAAFFDPARLLLAHTKDQTEVLAVAEEALRDGCIGFVVLSLTRALDLREGRRLQLAAEKGRATGLCLIPEGMGSNATQSRWQAVPLLGANADSTLMQWQIIKNKEGTIGAWNVRWDAAAHRLDVVSTVAKRPCSAPAPA